MSAVTAVPFLDLGTAFKAIEAEWLETIRASGAKFAQPRASRLAPR